ncbi:MAG: copper chaperone PCu(A)C [Gammaproteobacteria bacterium]|nr:MAG: copper chaperone PCu(A)C [Gammaproteobacteria bacterium]
MVLNISAKLRQIKIKLLKFGIFVPILLFFVVEGYGADLCAKGLCVVRAQIQSTGLMTNYQTINLILENRTSDAVNIEYATSDVAQYVDIGIFRDGSTISKQINALTIPARAYMQFNERSNMRFIMIGLREQLQQGTTIYLTLQIKEFGLFTIPVTVI